MTSMTAVTDQHRQQYSEVLLARAATLTAARATI